MGETVVADVRLKQARSIMIIVRAGVLSLGIYII
jgi:hypothetical protein